MKKIRVQTIILVSLLLTGCNLLRRTTKSTEESRQQNRLAIGQKLNSDQQRITDGSFLTYKRDSSWNAYTIRLWPKGKLSYTTDAGFDGVFDSISISGNIKKISGLQSNNSIKEVYNLHKDADNQLNYSADNKEKKNVTAHFPDLKVILVLGLVIGITVIYVVKRGLFSGR